MAKGRKTGGRARGTPNKATAELKDMILRALDGAGGIKYLKARAVDTPGPFLALIGKVLPQTVNANHSGTVTLESIVAKAMEALPRGEQD